MELSAINGIESIQKIRENLRELNGYDVLYANAEALGGLDALLDEKNTYTESEMSSSSDTYTIYEWNKMPSYNRKEYYFEDELYFESGDTGEELWQNVNGDLTEFDDSEEESRKIREAMNQYEHLDQDNKVFEVDYKGVTFVDGKKNLRVLITNRLTNKKIEKSFDAETLMLTQEKEWGTGETVLTEYGNYKEINGIMRAHETKITNVTTGKVQSYDLLKLKSNIVLEDDIFDMPKASIMK